MAVFKISGLKLFLGEGVNKEIPDRLIEHGIKKVSVIIDSNLKAESFVRDILNGLKNKNIDLSKQYEMNTKEEPSYGYLDEVTEAFRGLDTGCFIGIGGGSACDMTKAVAIMLKNPGKGIDYRGVDKVKNAGYPVVLVPTTAGTGTEATKTAVFIDREANVKMGINGNNVDTAMAFLDPVVLKDSPKRVRIFSGLDAMVHCMEAASSRMATLIGKTIGWQAFKLLFDSFPDVVSDNPDSTALFNMQVGSYLAGMVMYNSMGGPAGALSYAIGVDYKIPHGIAGGIFLPQVIEINVKKGYEGYADIYDMLIPEDIKLDRKKKSEKFVLLFSEFYKKIGAPANLKEYGIKKSDIHGIAETMFTRNQVNLKSNPVDLSAKELEYILDRVVV